MDLRKGLELMSDRVAVIQRCIGQISVWLGGAALSIVLAQTFTKPAGAQSFFGTVITDPTVGADRGSASRVRPVDDITGYLTFDTYGSEDVGPVTLGAGLSLPNLAADGDQLDVVFVLGGPSETNALELRAGGFSYRIPLGPDGTMLFTTLNHGEVVLGTERSLAFDLTGSRTAFAIGANHSWQLAQTARVTVEGEIAARDVQGDAFGVATIDESLRYARLALLYEQGIPLLLQRRLAVSVTRGLSDFGASPVQNPLSSTPGAASDFLRWAASAEASIPLSTDFVANVGVIGQWTEDSLPASQRSGFATNGYARGFDIGFVNEDRCLGARTELAYNIELPDLNAVAEGAPTRFTQAYFGVDFGILDNVGNASVAGTSDAWSSASFGFRTLRGNFIGEVSIAQILDAPAGPVSQADTRLWLRATIAF